MNEDQESKIDKNIQVKNEKKKNQNSGKSGRNLRKSVRIWSQIFQVSV